MPMPKNKNELPSLDLLNSLFTYDPDTGLLKNRISRGRAKAGEIAGRVNKNGYLQVRINYVAFYTSRIVWKMATGADPLDKEIDHINGNRQDNRIKNLRVASRAENLANKPKYSGDFSLPKGVYRSATKNKYCACIKVNGKTRYLGTFSSPELAGKAFEDASRGIFKEYTNTRISVVQGCT